MSISLRYSVLAMPSTEFSFPPMLRGSCLYIRLRLARSSHAAVTTTRLKSESADVAWKNCREDHFESCRLRSSVTEKKGRREALYVGQYHAEAQKLKEIAVLHAKLAI